MQMTADEQTYLKQIAARIAARIERTGESFTEENASEMVAAAHAEMAEMTAEILEGKTFRAKAARKAISAATWYGIREGELRRQMLQTIDDLQNA